MQEAAASTRRARRQVLEEMNIMAELGELENIGEEQRELD
jgi:hypothetical protein